MNPDDVAITPAFIGVAKGFNLKVIAEACRDEDGMSFSGHISVTDIQGQYFNECLRVDNVARKLRGSNPEVHARAQAQRETIVIGDVMRCGSPCR
jgi:EAL domain-containing protein (putative c-di-GMP-specific phosphodiesterase class I)